MHDDSWDLWIIDFYGNENGFFGFWTLMHIFLFGINEINHMNRNTLKGKYIIMGIKIMNLFVSLLWISWKWSWFDDLNLNELYLDFSKFVNWDFLCLSQDFICLNWNLFSPKVLLRFTKENIFFEIHDLKFLLNIFYYLIS